MSGIYLKAKLERRGNKWAVLLEDLPEWLYDELGLSEARIAGRGFASKIGSAPASGSILIHFEPRPTEKDDDQPTA